MTERPWHCDATFKGGQTFRCTISGDTALAAFTRFTEYSAALFERFGEPVEVKLSAFPEADEAS